MLEGTQQLGPRLSRDGSGLPPLLGKGWAHLKRSSARGFSGPGPLDLNFPQASEAAPGCDYSGPWWPISRISYPTLSRPKANLWDPAGASQMGEAKHEGDSLTSLSTLRC